MLHVAVQPHFVIDDGENLEPIQHPPILVPANEWPSYSGERFPREVKVWETELLGNREQRRRKTPKQKANEE